MYSNKPYIVYVFPAGAGVILLLLLKVMDFPSFPRRCGGDPLSYFYSCL